MAKKSLGNLLTKHISLDIFGYIRGGNVPAPKKEGKQMAKDLLKQALGHRQILYTKCNLCGENWDKFINNKNQTTGVKPNEQEKASNP